MHERKPPASEQSEATMELLQKLADKGGKSSGYRGIGMLKSNVKNTSYKRWEGQSLFAMHMSQLKKREPPPSLSKNKGFALRGR